MFSTIFDTPFYPGMFSETTQAELRKHKVWPVIITLKIEFNVYLQALTKPSDGTKYILCDSAGLRQLVLHEDKEGNITLFAMPSSFNQLGPELTKVLESKNVKYLLGRISTLKQDTSSVLYNISTRGEKQFPQYMKEMTMSVLLSWEADQGRMRYSPSFSVDTRIKLLDMFLGKISKQDLTQAETNALAAEVHRMDTRRVKHQEYRDAMRNYLTGPKFLLIYDTTVSSLVLGAVELNNLEPMLDHAYETENLWYSGPESIFRIRNDLRRYKVVTDAGKALEIVGLDDELKDVVMSTLHLDKMNRSAKKAFSYADPLLPYANHGAVMFNDSSSLCWRSNSTVSNFFLIPDKRSLLA